MRSLPSLAAAMLLLVGLIAPPGAADDTSAPADPPCSTRHLVTAIAGEVVWSGYACLSNQMVLEASQGHTSTTWTDDATPETVCTALTWYTVEGVSWYGAPCGAVQPVGSEAATACDVLELSGQAGRDLCGVLASSVAAACLLPNLFPECFDPQIDCNAFYPTLQSSSSVQAQAECVGNCPAGEVGVTVGNVNACARIQDVSLCDTRDGYYGVIVGDTELCARAPTVRVCEDPYVGVIVNSVRACVQEPYHGPCDGQDEVGYKVGSVDACVEANVENCPSGYVGRRVNNVNACVPTPVVCPSGTYGIRPNCHTVVVCTSPEVGVKVDSYDACVDRPDPQPCTRPYYGVEPYCVLVENCDSGEVGAIVGGREACIREPQVCPSGSYGVQPSCHTVTLCPSGQVGVVGDGDATCYPLPSACPAPSVGVQPNCHTVAPCPTGTYGVKVDGSGQCHTAAICPSGSWGVIVDGTELCQTIPQLDDQDHDGATDTQELAAGSHPNDADSRPDSDDDGDGTFDRSEPYTGHSVVRALCSGAYGIVADPTCAGYAKPSGTAANHVIVDASDRVWVWDAVCEPGTVGSYTGCRNGNYAGSSTRYSGAMYADGYGWRYVADVPIEDSQAVPIVAPCSDASDDNDGDGVNSYRICSGELVIYRNGRTETHEGAVVARVGDLDDNDPNSPVPDAAVEDGPYTTVERSTGDGVHYKVGAFVMVAGQPVDLIQERTVDAGALPKTFSVPSGGSPSYGPDADGDGLPAYADVPMVAWTIQDSATLTTTTAPANAYRLAIDNNDNDHFVPGGPEHKVTLPSWVQPGPDGDMDGFPSTINVEYSTVTISTEGAATIERAPEQDQSFAVDSNDANPNQPAPQVDEAIPFPATGPLEREQTIPGVSTPRVNDVDFSTPEVGTPATCTAAACTEATPVLGPRSVTTPRIRAQSVPSSEQVCNEAPALCNDENRYCDPQQVVCLGPHGPTPLTPEVGPKTVTTPAVTAPALCQLAPDVCLPPMVLIEATDQHIEGRSPIRLTEPVSVAVSWTGLDGYVDPNVGEFSSIGPIDIPAPIPITVCANPCSVPVPAESHGTATVTVVLTVGTDEYVFTQPFSF